MRRRTCPIAQFALLRSLRSFRGRLAPFGARRFCSHLSDRSGWALPTTFYPVELESVRTFLLAQSYAIALLARRLPNFLRYMHYTNASWICQEREFEYNREMTVSELFNSQTKTIAFAAGILFVSSFASRILGLLRDALLSWRFGAGEITDMYFAAFRIPDFLYGVLVVGGISAAFLPLFSEYAQRDLKEAWKFANNLLNILAGGLAVCALLLFVFAPFLVKLVAPGFSEEQGATTATLIRVMLVSPLLFGLSAVFSGMLQYFQKFVAYALAPVLYNLGIIIGIVVLVPMFGIWGLAMGVVMGAFAHVAIQIPAVLKAGFSWQPLFNVNHPGLSKMVSLTGPRMIALVGSHVNSIVLTAVASTLFVGGITIFQYAEDLQRFPIGLVGVSFAMAAFPAFSRYVAQQDYEQLRAEFSRSFSQIVFFVLPIALFLFLLRAQIIRLVYGTTLKFGWEATQLTAAVLGIFAFGVLFYSLIPLLARTFFAMQDTKTPTFASILAIALTIALALGFIDLLSFSNAFSDALISFLKLRGISDVRITALPLAIVIGGAFQFLFLLFFLKRRISSIFQKTFFVDLGKPVLATFFAGAVSYALLQIVGSIFPLRTYVQVLIQSLVAGLGGIIVYILVSFLLKSSEMLSLKDFLSSHNPFLTKKK